MSSQPPLPIKNSPKKIRFPSIYSGYQRYNQTPSLSKSLTKESAVFAVVALEFHVMNQWSTKKLLPQM